MNRFHNFFFSNRLILLCLAGSQFITACEHQSEQEILIKTGEASWYGEDFKNKKTASGDLFDPTELTAASRDLPLGSIATVTNLENGKKVIVVINDRGPYADDRIIDLSRAAAKKIDMLDDGTTKVMVESEISTDK